MNEISIEELIDQIIPTEYYCKKCKVVFNPSQIKQMQDHFRFSGHTRYGKRIKEGSPSTANESVK